MRSSKIIDFEGIGEVSLRKYKGCKNLRIAVKHDGAVRVSLPYWVTWQAAIDFLREKYDWILNQKARITEIQLSQPTPKIFTRQEVTQARTILLARLQLLAANYGYSFNRVSFRNQKTVWGSCSYRNNISLNINLILLPDELIDYILLHELAHTRVKNHSLTFWNELDKVLGTPGKAKYLQKKLRNFKIGVA